MSDSRRSFFLPVATFGVSFALYRQEALQMMKMFTWRARRPSLELRPDARKDSTKSRTRAGLSIGAAAMAAMVLCSPRVASADVVLDWNATMLTTLTGLPPFQAQRFAAITQLAVFEAVNAVEGDYKPYLGTIRRAHGASAEAAAAQAAHDVLMNYFAAKAPALDNALAVSLLAVPDGPAKSSGIAVGKAAAAAMIARRANDGSVPPASYTPLPAAPGEWQATPSCGVAALGANFQWSKVTPFGVPDVRQFLADPPPSLNSGKYTRDFAEVKALGRNDSGVRPQDREDVAFFYAAGLSPAAWANWAARQIATVENKSLSENARALALLNMALNDASVAVFDSKYYYHFWRPETAIHAADTDGNRRTDADITFMPLIVTPCFPSYPSNHGTASAAAAEVLERLYGPSGHDITFTVPSLPGLSLHYTSFAQIVADVSDARVYGGIHFRFDQEEGERQGERVGHYVYEHNLQPAHGPDRDEHECSHKGGHDGPSRNAPRE
jgi:hypothetical protein